MDPITYNLGKTTKVTIWPETKIIGIEDGILKTALPLDNNQCVQLVQILMDNGLVKINSGFINGD
jgi:hypothetical protein